MVEMKDTQQLKKFYHIRSTRDCDRQYESGTHELKKMKVIYASTINRMAVLI